MEAVIDWNRAWLAPFVPVLQAALGDTHLCDCPADAGDWLASFNAAAAQQGIRNHHDLALRFVDQAALPAGMAYEAFISATGCVPTRSNLHDFFNALVWLMYPLAKTQLNAAQAAELSRCHVASEGQPRCAVGSSRGPLRDRATIFDENAAILVSADPAIETALRAHSWHDGLLTQRSAFGERCEVRLFGHALIEKLVMPYKAITAHVWVLPVEINYFSLPVQEKRALVDCLLGEGLRGDLLQIGPMPLPVLGVPRWWDRQDAAFYADATVFRPKNKKSRKA